MIIIKNITKIYGAQKALDNVNFKLQKGEILGFLGLGFGDIKSSSLIIKGIGLDSPLGKQLLNVRKGDSINFNQKSIFISNCF